MLIIRGVNVFPSQIEQALLEVAGVEPHYQLILERRNSLDCLEVQVEVAEAASADRASDELRARVRRVVESALGISVSVSLAAPRSLPRSEGKAKRVVDRRVI